LLRKVVNADEAVYIGGMESYTAGQAAFVSKDRIGQDGGEFVTAWLDRQAHDLADRIREDLTHRQDLITILAAPLLDNAPHSYTSPFEYDRLVCFQAPSDAVRTRFAALADAAAVLDRHLRGQTNKLFRLRQSVLFACFVLERHLAWLEHYYVPGAAAPVFLLDLSGESNGVLARASQVSYIRVCQAISRFYVWAFAHYLAKASEDGAEQLAFLAEATPTYKNLPTTPAMNQYWELAREQANGYTGYAQAIYDILAMEAESNPIKYLRQLGIRSGLMQPTSNRVTTKRFAVRQDMLEVLVRSVVQPGESLDLAELLERLWQHYHVVVGGRAVDENRLLEAQIYQANAQALQANMRHLAYRLQDLSFARLLADGVLQVEVRDDHVD
jgi:hypothetical protein